MKYLGCAYYPEYWGIDRVKTDADLMKQANINIVRIGEFAWSRMEPEENQFDLGWLHKTIRLLGDNGINIILCTPTATPPAWLTFRYPDTLLMLPNGQRFEHGSRRHYCYSSDTYRYHTARIVTQLAVEFSSYENVIAWQIDNEPDFGEKGRCYCPVCQGKFQDWLKEKYGDIRSLNEAWKTGFWSMDYSDWSQVRLASAGHYSSRQLDTRRFTNAMLSDFILTQAEIIKNHQPQAMVSTNLNGDIFTSLDYFHLFSKLDVAFKDLYFDICTMDDNVMILNQFRSFKPGQKFWITETGAGMCGIGRPSHPGQFKAWMWSSYAHGADAHVVFRWRTCLSGQEQELEGMLEHSGHPGHRYLAIQNAFEEMRRISAILSELPLPQAKVAIVHDYEVMWGYQSAEIGREINYSKNFSRIFQPFYENNVPVDIIPPSRDLTSYRLVILPSLMMIDADFAARIISFVQQGGIVLAQGQIGMRDRFDNFLSIRGPQFLQDLFGVWINGGMVLYSCVDPDESWSIRENFKVALSGFLGGQPVDGFASIWLGDLEASGCDVLLSVKNDTYAGQPAIVEKRNGKGIARYCAAQELDSQLWRRLIDDTIQQAGISVHPNLPRHVEVIHRGSVVFVINHLREAIQIDLKLKGRVLRGCLEDGVAKLSPYDVLIIDQQSA